MLGFLVYVNVRSFRPLGRPVTIKWTPADVRHLSPNELTNRDGSRFTSSQQSSETRSLNESTSKEALFNAVREAGSRLQALERLLQCQDLEFTDAECKTLLTAVIFCKAEYLLAKFIEVFRKQRRLTSELVYMGLRTACRRRVREDLPLLH